MARFSIITPSFNQASFIADTLKSVLKQYVNIQYIIIDGGSADGTIDTIRENENQLFFWVSEPDNGQSHAINKGLKRATGEIINWLNSDDYYESEALTIVSKHFDASVSGLGGRSRLFNSQGILSYSRGTDIYPGNVAKTLGWARIDQPETFFSKQAWEEVGLLNEDLHYCMDREWWMRYLYQFGLNSFKKIDDVLVNFRIHEDSKTTTAQPGFLREHHSLFYAIAKVLDLEEALHWMECKLDINTSLKTAISSWEPTEVVKKAFHYYLLKSADEAYASNQFSLASGFLQLVDSSSVGDEIQLYRKLKSRIPFGPIIKFLRK